MITTPVEQYMTKFEDIKSDLPGETLSWLATIRKQALRSISKNGFPHRKHEEWKYTDISHIAETFFHPLQGDAPLPLWKELNGLGLDFTNSFPVLFLDGRYLPLVADTNKPPAGLTIKSLQRVLEENPESVQKHLARLTDTGSNIFTDLSTAFMNDGAFIQVSKNARMSQPIQLVFISTSQLKPVVSQPRNLFVLAEGAEATIVQKFVSLNQNSDYLTNAVTEIILGQHAKLEHLLIQEENHSTSHINTIRVQQEQQSRFASQVFTFGGGLTRNSLDIELNAENAECSLEGLFVANGNQHIDNHTRVDHRISACTSSELYKGVLDDHSRGVFNGKVYVHPDAQQTVASQNNPNLLLSRNAEIDTKPQLEIYADDVSCSHGATVGQLDEKAVFYLRSRGLDEETARNLLIFSFAEEMIQKVRIEPLRDQLKNALTGKLSKADSRKELN
jgi:Fe-S cluster assembly protein SufD